MPTNPILDELSGLSPGAQQALMGAHSATTLAPHPPPVDPGLQAPSKIQKPAQIGAPPPAPTATMSGPPPSMGAPSMPNVEAPRGTLQGDQNERGRLEATGPGITQIHSKIENSQFGQNHPTLGKIAGYGAEIPLRVLEAAGSMLGPVRSAEQLLPGTQAHHAMEMRNLNSNIGNESKENLQGAQAGEANARTGLTTEETTELPGKTASAEAEQAAQTKHLGAATNALENPKGDWKELAGYSGPKGEPLEINSVTGETRPANAPGAKLNKTEKEGTPQQQTYDDLIAGGMTPVQAYEKIREKPGGTVINQGTWTLDEGPDGKPLLFNSKTGETREAPAGLQKSGTHAKQEQATAPAKQAMEYAHDYASRKVHTGPGDEALMEKFFELAKPSSGFRMSQPQIDMLKNAQSWMSGLEAHLRHATTGTWFSDTQRQQITDTMQDLAKAKGIGGGNIGGATQSFTDGGKTYNIPADQVEDFKKDHPNAR